MSEFFECAPIVTEFEEPASDGIVVGVVRVWPDEALPRTISSHRSLRAAEFGH